MRELRVREEARHPKGIGMRQRRTKSPGAANSQAWISSLRAVHPAPLGLASAPQPEAICSQNESREQPRHVKTWNRESALQSSRLPCAVSSSLPRAAVQSSRTLGGGGRLGAEGALPGLLRGCLSPDSTWLNNDRASPLSRVSDQLDHKLIIAF